MITMLISTCNVFITYYSVDFDTITNVFWKRKKKSGYMRHSLIYTRKTYPFVKRNCVNETNKKYFARCVYMYIAVARASSSLGFFGGVIGVANYKSQRFRRSRPSHSTRLSAVTPRIVGTTTTSSGYVLIGLIT